MKVQTQPITIQQWCCRVFIPTLCFIAIFLFPTRVHAACEEFSCNIEAQGEDEYLTCNTNKQKCLEAIIAQTQQQAQTLNGTISILNGQLQVQELQVKQTTAEIKKLEKEIAELGTRITGLELSLDRMTTLLVERVDANYKRNSNDTLLLLLSANSFAEFLSEYKYIQVAQKHISEVMKKAEAQRITYDQQKTIKEEKQIEVEKKRKKLEEQKKILANQKLEKQTLLEVTKNDERRYQQLLAEAKAEVASFKNYATSKGGGTLPPQNSPDGWYFSQRDERWAGMTIGSSRDSMLQVGCLINSTAMIKKKFGESVTPISIASNNSYFFANTAYMLKPWPAPDGYSYADVGYSQSRLDDELQKNPVIVRLSAGPYGTHFVVIKEKKDGKYIMHDPWEGFDKNLQDFYSLGQITRISYLVKR